MKRSVSIKQHMKLCSFVLLVLVMVMGAVSTSHAEWKYGIGTGIFGLNVDGDVGVHTALAGSVQFEIDLDAGDTSDLMESAFGFGGYATDGTWMIMLSYGALELEGSKSTALPGIGNTVNARVNWERTSAELTVGYPVYNEGVRLLVDAGVRYTEHDYNSQLVFTGTTAGTTTKDISADWTDFLIGVTLNVPLAPDWSWNTRANAGFGGSEGTYLGQTGVSWRFLPDWSASLYAKYAAVEYEDGTRGNADWYLYDADEFGAGINILYNF